MVEKNKMDIDNELDEDYKGLLELINRRIETRTQAEVTRRITLIKQVFSKTIEHLKDATQKQENILHEIAMSLDKTDSRLKWIEKRLGKKTRRQKKKESDKTTERYVA